MKKRVKKKSGPYLAAAFFCETSIVDSQGGAISAIRMIDQLAFFIDPSAPPDFPSDEKRIPLILNGLVCFKTGDSPGDHHLKLIVHSPSGKSNLLVEQTVTFTPSPHGGLNFRVLLNLTIKDSGLYWFHVYLDGKRYTRMPLNVVIERVTTPPAQES